MHMNLKPNKHKIIFFNTTTSVHPPPQLLSAGARGWGLSLQPNFQKGGLDKTSTFKGGCWERGGGGG